MNLGQCLDWVLFSPSAVCLILPSSPSVLFLLQCQKLREVFNLDYPHSTFLLKTLTIVSGPDMVDLTFHNFVSYKENVGKVLSLRARRHWETLGIGALRGEQERRGGERELNPVSVTGKVINNRVYVPVSCGASIILEISAQHGGGPVEEIEYVIFVLCVLCMDKQTAEKTQWNSFSC